MHTVVETSVFAADCKEVGLTEDERLEITLALATNPKLGDIMPNTGGARKWRFARPGMGKRGGCRVVSYFGGDEVPVFLLGIFAKGDRVDMSMAEKREMKRALEGLADDYRASMQSKVTWLVESSG